MDVCPGHCNGCSCLAHSVNVLSASASCMSAELQRRKAAPSHVAPPTANLACHCVQPIPLQTACWGGSRG